MITPEEASANNLLRIKSSLKKACVEIDKQLSNQYYGDNVVNVSLGELNERVIKEILSLYRTAWNVEYKGSTHRNERYNNFRFSKKQ